jgi:hypothetical protein
MICLVGLVGTAQLTERWVLGSLARLFISRPSEMLTELPKSPLPNTEGMNVDMINNIAINIDAETVRVDQCI